MAEAANLPAGSHKEWLAYVQPTGLVVAAHVLDDLASAPIRQTAADTAAVRGVVDGAEEPYITDAWAFASTILEWDASRVAGAPEGPELPEAAKALLPEHHATLRPDWVVLADAGRDDPTNWLLFVRHVDQTIDLDKRGALDGWDATPSQQMERLLRETGAPAGLLIGGIAKSSASGRAEPVLRLITAPRGETSGWIDFPVKGLTEVSGRPMLAGLKLLVGKWGLYAAPIGQRLPDLIKESRAAQANVSTALAGQVLAALHALLRGLHQAAPLTIEAMARDPARSHELYEGLLTVLMRLVFLLYAEDRDLLPSKREGPALELYESNYSVRGLLAKLEDEQARFPATMDERMGGWGRLLALFRLVSRGDPYHWIQPRGGRLFDPDVFPFLEGRGSVVASAKVPRVSDACVLEVLSNLMRLKGERLSYRTLDVEQIGSVYETVMGFTVQEAEGPSLAIRAGKKDRIPVFVNLQELLDEKQGDRMKWLKEHTDRGKFPAEVEKGIKAAATIDDMAAAFEASARGGVVDERASPAKRMAHPGSPILQPTDERRRTGSHYTPRSLTEPIVRHALEPAFERLGENATHAAILELKVCDPAMGSGAFLVEACRQIGARLEQAWIRWPDAKPAIPEDEDEVLHARRLVAQKCLYGVDKNPMATDLARLSLWLATLARDHEFTFLDHALKSGDSLVGLTNRQIMALSWDDQSETMDIAGVAVRSRLKEAEACREKIRNAPEHSTRAELQPWHDIAEAKIGEVRLLGDAVVRAFFDADNVAARKVALERVRQLVRSTHNWNATLQEQRLVADKIPMRPFHWEVEFPEVFRESASGFDAIVGNPPFIGGKRISTELGAKYPKWISTSFEDVDGNSDIVAIFFRKAFTILRPGGMLGLISTNTINQGDTRRTGLRFILRHGGNISRAIRRLIWPGEAAVIVSTIHIKKGAVEYCYLDNKKVSRISPYLIDSDFDEDPEVLVENQDVSHIGSIILGMGFTFDDTDKSGTSSAISEMERIIDSNPESRNVIKGYLGGEELNNDPKHHYHRYVIDFAGLLESEARQKHNALFSIVESKVKPHRLKLKRGTYRDRWWLFAEPQNNLYRRVGDRKTLYALCRVSPHLSISKVDSDLIFADSLVVFISDDPAFFCVLQSRVHEVWGKFFASSMKDDLRYTPTDCLETFPFPQRLNEQTILRAAGETYYDHRAGVLLDAKHGLTKIYNSFHDAEEQRNSIVELRRLHDAMDHAVLRAYGWDDLVPMATPQFEPLFDEDDEAAGPRARKKFRYRWPEAVRDEVLARLLALNAERAKAQAVDGPMVSPLDAAAAKAREAGKVDLSHGLAPDHGPLFPR